MEKVSRGSTAINHFITFGARSILLYTGPCPLLSIRTHFYMFDGMKKLLLAVLLISFSASAREMLVVGDSLTCGSFGRQLMKNLTSQGYNVTLYCAVSSAPTHWLDGKNPTGFLCKTMTSENQTLANCNPDGLVPKLETLLEQYPAPTVVVALGTNTLISGHADATYRRLAQIIFSNHRNCIWIGPPQMNEAESKGYPAGRMNQLNVNLATFYPSLIQATQNICRVIDSRPATAPNTPGIHTIDGIHRTTSAGIYWADAIKSQF